MNNLLAILRNSDLKTAVKLLRLITKKSDGTLLKGSTLNDRSRDKKNVDSRNVIQNIDIIRGDHSTSHFRSDTSSNLNLDNSTEKSSSAHSFTDSSSISSSMKTSAFLQEQSSFKYLTDLPTNRLCQDALPFNTTSISTEDQCIRQRRSVAPIPTIRNWNIPPNATTSIMIPKIEGSADGNYLMRSVSTSSFNSSISTPTCNDRESVVRMRKFRKHPNCNRTKHVVIQSTPCQVRYNTR